MVDFKTKGNLAFQQGKYNEAIELYTQGIESTHDKQDKCKIFSNRSAAYHQNGQLQEALADANSAIACNRHWSKAHSRRATALYALQDFTNASLSYLKASQLASSFMNYRKDLINCILLSCKGIHKGGSLMRKAQQKYVQGDVYARAEPGAYEMLLETVYAEDVCVCMASLLQLSVLASCPEHRVKFFKSKGGLDVFSHFSQRADLDACFPQRNSLQEAAPALSKFYQTVIGLPYEMTHPKCVLAKGISALTEYESCAPDISVGLFILHDKLVMRSIAHLVDETGMCPHTQHFLSITLKKIVEAVKFGGKDELMLALDSCLMESLQKAIRSSRENERRTEETYLLHLLHTLQRHPDHPDNQIPQS